MQQKLNSQNVSTLLMKGGLSFVMVLFFSFTLNAQNGETIVDNAAAAYKKANGISAKFIMTNSLPHDGYADHFEGTIQMKGDKFILETPDLTSWFDGKTLWSYMNHTDEVNITTPSGDDLLFTNPSILLNSYKNNFTVEYKGEDTLNGKKAQKVELTPKTKGDITKVEMLVDKSTNYPLYIAAVTKNGGIGTIVINDMKTGVNQPDNLFVFNPSDHPDVEVVDLR